MGVTKFLARDLVIEIGDGGSGGGYIPIKGLNSITHSPTSTDAETSDFNSEGRSEHLKAERGDSWTCAGFTLEDVLTGERDPGQARVEAVAQIVGPLALVPFRLTSPGGNTIEFVGSVEVTLSGGGTNDASQWQAVVRASGKITFSGS
jgi:hypothetical protein